MILVGFDDVLLARADVVVFNVVGGVETLDKELETRRGVFPDFVPEGMSLSVIRCCNLIDDIGAYGSSLCHRLFRGCKEIWWWFVVDKVADLMGGRIFFDLATYNLAGRDPVYCYRTLTTMTVSIILIFDLLILGRLMNG